MAISAFSGIRYGTTMTMDKNKHDALKSIESDGRVDKAFVQEGASFIGDIRDSRIENFLKTGAAPSAEWKAHELGGFDSANQSLFVENERVVLRTRIEDQGETVRHLIEAPFDKATGQVAVESSTEGFNIVGNQSAKHQTFHIPL